MRIKKKRKPLTREGCCPICAKPLDRHKGQQLCTHCGYLKQEGY